MEMVMSSFWRGGGGGSGVEIVMSSWRRQFCIFIQTTGPPKSGDVPGLHNHANQLQHVLNVFVNACWKIFPWSPFGQLLGKKEKIK